MSKKNILLSFILIFISLFCPHHLEAKRPPKPEVKPVIFMGVKYVVPEMHSSRFLDVSHTKKSYLIEAFDAKTEKKLWDLDIYQKTIDPERTGQGVFISNLEISGNNLLVTNERNELYKVFLKENNTKPQKVWRMFITTVPKSNNTPASKPNSARRNIVYLIIALVGILLLGAFVLLRIKKKYY